MRPVLARFAALVGRLGGEEAVAQRWAQVLGARYGEAHRAYHTLAHIEALCADVDRHAAALARPDRVELAVFFHDAVYDVAQGMPPGQNERRSAELFGEFAKEAGVPKDPADVAAVRDYIVATAKHQVPDEYKGDADLELFLDMDMAVVARPWERYREYCAQVRSEYAIYSDADFAKGRAAFLRGVGSVFLTDTYRASAEQQAQANMERELRELESAQ